MDGSMLAWDIKFMQALRERKEMKAKSSLIGRTMAISVSFKLAWGKKKKKELKKTRRIIQVLEDMDDDQEIDAEPVVVPPKPVHGEDHYLTRLWNNMYGEQAEVQVNDSKGFFSKKSRNRSVLASDIKQRLNEGTKPSQLLDDLKSLVL